MDGRPRHAHLHPRPGPHRRRRRPRAEDLVTAGSVRLDSWLWAIRVYKTRSAATTACRAGHVRVNGERAKAAQQVKPGDELRVRIAGFDRILVVREPIAKRVGAPQAALAVDDRTPPAPPRESIPAFAQRDRGAGRPTKRERREIDRLRGQ
ncbi:RNA-binding S4 domain-containing protein [Microbacterium sp. dk485]|uniref:RNA-binding S4 domain-containing protein n=1 Tax=Microbacterium wangchenii TaxID=2541726 RepID=A0ABX5SU28_9MICO|nr:RNA-binding S4 domain-containing protein [Microbacterium sp. EYE_512]QBR88369.1 RNA-binding S4 domain-containing protein [Microbacterium wangchenii]TFV82579.1 RNA-binding S4 domain-containing protein [Microbacterium sp. dk485]TXK20095.1 RNA-binding S4 domain-containing protein [Microbacterium wangchenii]